MAEMKGITVRVDADLHGEVKAFIESHNMTMGEFVALALDNELHPKIQMKEACNMGGMRTIAVQVPEELFQDIKDYLRRNNMTQRQFLLGLIQDELQRDQEERENEEEQPAAEEEFSQSDSETPEEEDSMDQTEGETEGMTMVM